jgi:membrane protein
VARKITNSRRDRDRSPGVPARRSVFLRWAGHTVQIIRLLFRATQGFYRDNGFFLSAGISFNILISLIPLLMLLLALVGSYLYRTEDVLVHIQRYVWSAAPGLDPKLIQALLEIVRTRRIVGVLGFAGLLWVSTWVFGSLRIALNVIFRINQGRGIVRGMGVDILMICAVGSFVLLSMALTSFVALVRGYQPLLPFAVGPVFQWILKYPVPLFFSYCTFFLIYAVLPHRKVSFRSASLAALAAGTLWEVAKHFFGWYVAHVTRLPLIYGSLSTVVISVLWVYYSAAILLIGGEFACLLENDSPALRNKNQQAKAKEDNG